jgi:hypothetical protein
MEGVAVYNQDQDQDQVFGSLLDRTPDEDDKKGVIYNPRENRTHLGNPALGSSTLNLSQWNTLLKRNLPSKRTSKEFRFITTHLRSFHSLTLST